MSGSEAVRIKIDLDEQEAISDFKKLEAQGRRTFRSFEKESRRGTVAAGRFGKALAGIRGHLVALAGGMGAAAVIRKSSALFIEQEKQVTRLNAALKLQGITAKSVSRDMRNYASALQEVTIHGDEAHLSSMALAMSMGASADQAKELARAASEASAALGIGLETATRQFAKTYGGYAGELGEIFPEMKQFSPAQLRGGAAPRLAIEKFGGSAASLARTQGGQLTQALNALGDKMEDLGKNFVAAAVLGSKGAKESASFLARVRHAGDRGAGVAMEEMTRFFQILPWNKARMGGAFTYRGAFGAKTPAEMDALRPGGSSDKAELQLARAELAREGRGYRGFFTGAGLQPPRLGGMSYVDIEKKRGALGGITPAQVAKILEGTRTPRDKYGENMALIGRTEEAYGQSLGYKEGSVTEDPDFSGMRRKENLNLSRGENPELHQFFADIGMGVQNSIEGALRTAFTGGSAKEILQQFSMSLAESVVGSLSANLASGFSSAVGLGGGLDDAALAIGGSVG